jgi:hypothetical protein
MISLCQMSDLIIPYPAGGVCCLMIASISHERGACALIHKCVKHVHKYILLLERAVAPVGLPLAHKSPGFDPWPHPGSPSVY